MAVRELVWGALDPYEGSTVPELADPVGWGASDPVFLEVVPRDARLIVEIGSWEGASALRMANIALDAEIVCVDTWLGWPECWTDEHSRRCLGLSRGRPHVWERFAGHVVGAGLTRRITPAPMVAAHWWELASGWGLRPDVVYVDGDHSYDGVFRDIAEAIHGVKSRIVFGHDYNKPQVREAVDALIRTEVRGDFWVWRRK